MYETTGKIDEDVLVEIQANRHSRIQMIALWAIFIGAFVYVLVAAFQKDGFGAVMAFIMLFLAVRALWMRPQKWMKIQLQALEANKTGSLEFTTSYGEDAVNIWCRTNGWKGTLAYSNFVKGIETDNLIVLFTFKQEYVVTWKKQLAPHQIEALKEHLNRKFSGRKFFKRFKWIVNVTK